MFLKLSACVLLLGDERVLRRVGAYEYGRAQDRAGAAQAKDAS